MVEPVRSSSKNLFTLAEDQKYIPVPHNAVTLIQGPMQIYVSLLQFLNHCWGPFHNFNRLNHSGLKLVYRPQCGS